MKKNGELDKKAKHQEIIHNANAEISHHLSQYHFAMANKHAEKEILLLQYLIR